MKKLLFLLFALALLSSCEPMAKESKYVVTIPTEIYQSLKNDTVPTTMYVYKFDGCTYYFNERKEITTVYYTGSALQGELALVICIFIAVVAFSIGALVATNLDS